ncbi:MAG TPA: hypothetical protein VNI36_11025 [Candidatus Dormibacteraeota bacterium]|nr:hypothetical protein [Candidatus Dormibacteraeota bacterium]
MRNAIASDPVVARHYARFDLSRARMIRLDRDRLMHVSYRIGDQIYWTKRALQLKKGEILITDGSLTARTRCGNQLAKTVVGPVSSNEPTPLELNTPGKPYNPAGQLESYNQSPPFVGGTDFNIPPGAESLSPSGPVAPNAPTFFGPTGDVPPIPSFNTPQPDPTVSVPEPCTGILLFIALLGLLVLFLYQKRCLASALKTQR